MKSTIKVGHYQKLAQNSGNDGDDYKGLKVLANRGLHEHVISILSQLVPSGASLLELGAGTGSLSLRLADQGYAVTAVDYVEENFKATHSNIRFLQADLNKALPAEAAGNYDAVLAVEIIEHLENTRQVVRNMAEVVKPGGRLLITTPNICNPKSVFTFLSSGRFDLFLPRHYEKDGHINPVPWFVLHDALLEAGMEQITISSFKSAAWSFKGLVGSLLQFLCLGWQIPRGKILVAVASRPE